MCCSWRWLVGVESMVHLLTDMWPGYEFSHQNMWQSWATERWARLWSWVYSIWKLLNCGLCEWVTPFRIIYEVDKVYKNVCQVCISKPTNWLFSGSLVVTTGCQMPAYFTLACSYYSSTRSCYAFWGSIPFPAYRKPVLPRVISLCLYECCLCICCLKMVRRQYCSVPVG